MDLLRFWALLFGFMLLVLVGEGLATTSDEMPDKVCRGTDQGMTSQGSSEHRYETYKAMYTNCTFVEKNLELVFLEHSSSNYNLSFLQHIREVTGYVLIMSVHVDNVSLSSLRIIRGRTLFEYEQKYYSLYVALNYKQGSRTVGLKELQFTSLYEILAGDVFLVNNYLLCFENTINWNDILSGEGADVTYRSDASTSYRRPCGECDESCHVQVGGSGSRHCWGEGPDMCQTLTRVVCTAQCDDRCYGQQPNQCCHPECAGGCTGPTKSECWTCENFYNDGNCEPFCPQEIIYDPKTYSYIPNPNVKYSYGTLCVDECPGHLLVDKGACVSGCGAGREPDENRVCKECQGPCRKTCLGSGRDFVHAGNIQNFTGCTIITGNIRILQPTFLGDEHNNIPRLNPEALKVFETIQEVNGYIVIQGNVPQFKTLSFFKNLKYIHGRTLDKIGAALHIYDTSLQSLDLVSLTAVNHGTILVAQNRDLCYAESIKWKENIAPDPNQQIAVRLNRDQAACAADGFSCDTQCDDDGCWGPGNDQCITCKNFRLGIRCLQSCEPSLGVYNAGNNMCGPCHEECTHQCVGEGADKCDECSNVKDGPYCVNSCPETKYPDENNVCQMCHRSCEGGCTGPRNSIGLGACNGCTIAVMDQWGNITKCLPAEADDGSAAECESGYYMQRLGKNAPNPMAGKTVCLDCDPECSQCYGPGLSFCTECVHYEQERRCVANCSSNYYADNSLGMCRKCDDRCLKCRGPTAQECISCKQYKVYRNVEHKDEDPQFNCTESCPDFAAYTMQEELNGISQIVCVPENMSASKSTFKNKNLPIILGTVLGLIAIGVIGGLVYWRLRVRATENKLRLTAKLTGVDETEPLTPTDAKPDMASLRLIKECELRRGNIIGSGAFGTVYKGIWIPDSENVKIPVAIKVLQEGTSPNMNKELLEEARIMASVDNPCCIRIIAVCMTAQMMLITQLMPLGCLLDYVRKNKTNIGSKVLLNWCTQIAKGMTYLETERGIVHRDLAARNVLVQSPAQVKITDFGLAKLLDYDEEEFHAAGGKMPIKWLALECIQHRIFTHKSDVWSFGVTMWELFTYGKRPYENVRAKDIPDLLEKGERLPQPTICTIDVYMFMIKCWMLDAQSRPNFKELAEEFAKMARDPGRYLVIQGDKLMRLPSHSVDTHELVRNMSVANDGPETVMDAEEYMQPQMVDGEPLHVVPPRRPPGYRPPSHLNHVNGKIEKVREDSQYDNDHQPDIAEGASHDGESPQAKREKKYSGLESAAASKRQREAEPARDSVNSRYSSDPCRVLGENTDDRAHMQVDIPEDVPDMPAPPTPIPPRSDAVDGRKPPEKNFTLPIDEDDYLQPKSSNPAAYMDLVDTQDYLGPDEQAVPPVVTAPSRELPQPQYMDMSPTQNAMDNPEYYDNNCKADAENANIDPRKSEKEPLRLRTMSSESGASSDHDYYNEYDQLNRNKKPVMFLNPRTESAV